VRRPPWALALPVGVNGDFGTSRLKAGLG